ncbi:hypothetical protein JIX56_40665 [Streptomyces sp. CA-210063]|uniref:hypothetical protein n=1 Tax=Streptomyces sp. CA-210063 TaxID=2801029 RepID=UPI00214B0F25|nr:hypothetical protein [Streptomyces sp. CA-210063]UUU37446.1 hypothetical protein JIX56_40665 [Streptomyces sp. CA-210063]
MSSDTSTLGGVREGEAKALTVVPCGRRTSRAVTTATGEATAAMASRNACGVALPGSWAVAGWMVVVMTGPAS